MSKEFNLVDVNDPCHELLDDFEDEIYPFKEFELWAGFTVLGRVQQALVVILMPDKVCNPVRNVYN